jgi:hypothetical protein
MITGSFISQLGTVTVELDDGISPNINFDIATVGALTYDFDQTPDSVSIDKVQALYNYFDISAPAFNREGVDIWSRLTTATQFGGQIRASVTIGEFSFGFRLRNPELSFDERSRIVKMRLIPFVDTGVEASTVFNALSGASFPVSVQGNVYQLPGVSVLDWIGEALRRIFGNNSPNIILPSKIGLDNDDYPSDLFGLASAGQRSFVMLNMTDNEFQEIEDGAQEFFPTGTISYPRFIDPPESMEVTGVGTSFDTQLRRFDIIFVNGNRLGTVLNDPTSATLFVMRVDPGNTLKEVRNESFTILRPILPSRIPVINSLKELAGAEGSIFGTGFSRNFYVNRLRKEGVTRVTLDWTKIIDFAPSTYYLSLGRSFVAQRASKDREGAGVYGRWPRRLITSDGETRESFLPNLTEFESITTGNPGGTKGLEIGLAPAYPHLNKVFRRPLGNSIETDSSTTVLESALTRTGLTSYFQALNNTAGGLMVEFSILGAFSLKPWDIFQFDTRAPEKYQDRQWRITSIAYDIINNVARVKAYQIDDIRTPVFADNPISFGINASFGQGLLPKGLFSSVQAQIGEAIGDVQDVLFVTARNYSGTITELLVNKAGDFDEADFPGGIIALKGWPVKVMNSITLETFDAVLAEDLKVVDRVVKTEPLDLGLNTLVAGSYLYVSERQILAGIITGDFAVRIFAESSSIGVLRQPVSGLTESLPVRLFAPVIAGQDFVLQSIGGQPYYLTVSVSANVGATELDIRDAGGAGQFVEAPAGAFLIADGRFNRASINVDPGRVQIGVEAEREANGIGVIVLGIFADTTVTELRVSTKRLGLGIGETLDLLDGTKIIVVPRGGTGTQEFVVDGAQSLSDSVNTPIAVQSKLITEPVAFGSNVVQPAWNQTGEITVQAGRIDLLVTEVNGLDTSLAGLTLEVGELEQDVGDLQTDVGVIGARTVLFTDVNGNIASIELISGTTGSAIGIKADQVLVDAGQTVFINSLKSEGFVTDDDLPTTFGNITIRSATAPTTRPDTTALVAGDRWLKSDAGELPHVWTGSVWAQEYVIIDGGSVSVGTILSANYNFVSGDFATAGSSFDLSQGNIISSQFSIINGNAKFKGALEAASGTFAGSLDAASGTFAGSLDAASGTFAGSLDAASGTFAGALSGGTIEIGTGNNVFKADANGIYLGNTTFASAPFRVTPAGVLTATGASITGAITADSLALNGAMSLGASGSINLNGNFLVDSSGFMSANGANIAGTITATAGTVGGISIANNQINSANNAFIVTDAGALTATNATITGAITATSGSFTGTVSTDNITATGGTVGGFTLDSTSLIAGTGATRISLHTTNGIHLGNNTFASAPFRVTPAGDLTANNATVTGTFTIEGGEFNAVIPVNDLGGIKSNNYVAGTSGWQIDGDGDAEFNNVTVRGNLDGVTGSLGALNVDGVLTIGATGSLDWSGGLIDTAGIKLTYGGYNSTPGSALRYLDGSTEKVVIHAVDAEGSPSIQAQINDNGGVFVFNIGSGLDLSDRPRVVRQEILSPSFRGTYKSADGTAGLTETIVFNDSVTNETNTVTIKNGLITAWTQTV